jgi:hypothetical protein
MADVMDGLNAGVMRLGNLDIQLSPLPLSITYFENAPSFSYLNGIIGVALSVATVVPDGANNTREIASIVSTLKCNIPAAIALRDAINGALLLAQPVEKSEGPAN